MTPSRSAAAPGLAVVTRMFGPAVGHVEHLAPRPGEPVDWPRWTPPEVVAALAARGVTRPWRHQVEAAQAAWSGTDVIVATGTASGKSLGYQLPVLAALLADPRATALYLSPTKALAADQSDRWSALGLDAARPARYDGDTGADLRTWVRDHARLVLTNPDMLHLGILPRHERWSRLLRRLRYVVVDECHSYRGLFGAHVALVLRRLRRVAAGYGADPTLILASATVADPAAAAERLTGRPAVTVTTDSAPHPGADFVLLRPRPLPDRRGAGPAGGGPGATDAPGGQDEDPWLQPFDEEPDPGSGGGRGSRRESDADSYTDTDGMEPVRRSAPAEAALLTAGLVAAGVRTLTFVRSRAGAEWAALAARRALSRIAPERAQKVAAYRGGYLPEDRRQLETAFAAGDLMAVTATNALELGIDIAGIDAVVLAGYPGSLASMWQQAGRSGRADRPGLAVFVAREDPLDSYLVAHPEAVFGRSVEAAVFDPTNPHVLGPHLLCAAAEAPLTDADIDLFGGAAAAEVLADLVAARELRARPGGYFPPGQRHPAAGVDLRGSGRQVAIVEADTGRLLGTDDAERAPANVHPGAVHLHRGQTFVVDELDLAQGLALVRAADVDWNTSPRIASAARLLRTRDRREASDGIVLATGDVLVTDQVVGYLRRLPDGSLLDAVELEMPESRLATRAVWYAIPERRLRAAGVAAEAWPGALHAAEHAAIGLLPLLATCDRADIGGLSTALHADTGQPTVIVYDGHPGGAGFAERGFAVAADWLAATRDAVASCPCAAGCPSCIQSPKCGNGNSPLDKVGAIAVLTVLTDALAGT